MSHAGSAKPLFTYLHVGPCLLDVLRLLPQKLSSSEQMKPSGFTERFCSSSCVAVLTELQQQQQLHQLWTWILTFVWLPGGAVGDAGGHPGCGAFCDEEPRWSKWVWTRISSVTQYQSFDNRFDESWCLQRASPGNPSRIGQGSNLCAPRLNLINCISIV